MLYDSTHREKNQEKFHGQNIQCIKKVDFCFVQNRYLRPKSPRQSNPIGLSKKLQRTGRVVEAPTPTEERVMPMKFS